MSTPSGDTPHTAMPAADASLPRPLRRVLTAWAGIVLAELGLWLALGRSPYLRPLWVVPAGLLLLGGCFYTVYIARRRRRDRRDEQHERRRPRSRRAR